jgi:hypothetical protein
MAAIPFPKIFLVVRLYLLTHQAFNSQPGRVFTNPGGMEGWVDLGGLVFPGRSPIQVLTRLVMTWLHWSKPEPCRHAETPPPPSPPPQWLVPSSWVFDITAEFWTNSIYQSFHSFILQPPSKHKWIYVLHYTFSLPVERHRIPVSAVNRLWRWHLDRISGQSHLPVSRFLRTFFFYSVISSISQVRLTLLFRCKIALIHY